MLGKQRVLVLYMLVGLLLTLAACGGNNEPTSAQTIKVSMLVEFSTADQQWFRNVEVPKGTDAYELTEKVTGGNLNSTYYPAFRSHLVQGVLGVEGKAPNYWIIWLWNEAEGKWEPLPVGADLYSLKEGHVLAWGYTDTSQDPQPPPAGVP